MKQPIIDTSGATDCDASQRQQDLRKVKWKEGIEGVVTLAKNRRCEVVAAARAEKQEASVIVKEIAVGV